LLGNAAEDRLGLYEIVLQGTWQSQSSPSNLKKFSETKKRPFFSFFFFWKEKKEKKIPDKEQDRLALTTSPFLLPASVLISDPIHKW